jgi:hypothetical protein
MATRRRTTPRRPPTRTRRSGGLSLPTAHIDLSPAVARSIVGIALLVLGAVTLIALALPGQGRLTDWWRDSIVPFFGAGRLVLPFALLVAGWYVEWGPGKEAKAPWGRILIGMTVAFVGFLGVIQLLGFSGAERDTGGRIGRALEAVLVPLVTSPGAFVIVLGMFVVGVLVMFDTTLRTVLAPVAKAVTAFSASLRTTDTDTIPGRPMIDPGGDAIGTEELHERCLRGIDPRLR